MSEQKKSGCLRMLVIFLIIISVIVLAAYWFVPKLIVKSMMSDSARDILPPEINRIVRQSEKEIPKVLAKLNLTPDQAISEIDRIDYGTVDRVIQRLSEKKSITRDETAELIKTEAGFTHLDTHQIERMLPRNISEHDINRLTTMFAENKGKIRLMMPTFKESIKQMIKESMVN